MTESPTIDTQRSKARARGPRERRRTTWSQLPRPGEQSRPPRAADGSRGGQLWWIRNLGRWRRGFGSGVTQDRDDAIDDRVDPALLDAARDQELEAQRPSVGHPPAAIEPDRQWPALVVLAKVPVVAVLDKRSPQLLERLMRAPRSAVPPRRAARTTHRAPASRARASRETAPTFARSTRRPPSRCRPGASRRSRSCRSHEQRVELALERRAGFSAHIRIVPVTPRATKSARTGVTDGAAAGRLPSPALARPHPSSARCRAG